MIEPKLVVVPLILAGLWLVESWLPFHPHFRGETRERLRHDARNLGLGALNAGVLALAVGGALAVEDSWARNSGVGLLRAVDLPVWLEAMLALLAMDLWMYAWHRANHRIPVLWRLHRLHHGDAEMDCTTAVRFHTGEILLSGCARLAVVPAIGMDLWQIGLYEAISIPVICLHHSNVRLPRLLDRGLIFLVVSPAVHRVHHSRVREETDSNYGSVLPWWDLLLGTFRLRPDASAIRFGLPPSPPPSRSAALAAGDRLPSEARS